ncbi:MAG: hypothetical protein MUF22_06390, partial [Chitinispirillaceae bacterium]|nr:hypothetical protein [Chitinispirillaceae bacterium]
GIIRAYAWNDSAAVRGWATFSKDTIAVRNVTFSPAEGTFSFGDSIRVSCALSLPPASYGTVVFCLYAISAPHATIVTYQGVRMEPDSTTGLWRSAAAIPLTYAGDINRMLVVKFRVISGGIEKNSEPASYNIGGRPNLSFVNKSLSIVWEKDSLRCHTRVINTGNAAAPPFAVSFYWGDRTSRDTIITLRRIDSLSLGREWSGSFAFPDTAGTLRFAGVIEAPFQEIVPDDNTAEGTFRVSIRNCSTPADTVFSVGRGCMVTPAAALSAPRRVFLFDAPVTDSLPLVTESRWLPLIGDSIAAMNIGCRPALLGSDSLVWIFLPDSLRAKLAKTASASGRIAVMHRDPVIDRWRFCGAGNQTGSSGNGPYALAELQDMRPPSIQATVYGREITSLDYAAKDKPFNIMLSDASGIAPSSVVLKLNRELLAKQLTSAVPEKGDLRTITVTAYPPASITVDSLKVTAADLAGNVGEQTFAYLPGQNLDIKFLSCHPNPFYLREGSVNGPLQKVRFAFLLTDNAREVTLGIYTVSGRKIWSWRGENLIGYQEVAWNARDHDGCRIANGTYYLKMIASGNQKSAKKTIRIAKLEGY